jgi:hypothetical protein
MPVTSLSGGHWTAGPGLLLVDDKPPPPALTELPSDPPAPRSGPPEKISNTLREIASTLTAVTRAFVDEASTLRRIADKVDDIEERLDRAQLNSIEARNP